jgi:hypothetical protein
MTPLFTAAKANQSTVSEPNDLLLLAAYEAVGNARVEEESGVGGQNSKCANARDLTCITPRNQRPKAVVESRRCRKNILIGFSSTDSTK